MKRRTFAVWVAGLFGIARAIKSKVYTKEDWYRILDSEGLPRPGRTWYVSYPDGKDLPGYGESWDKPTTMDRAVRQAGPNDIIYSENPRHGETVATVQWPASLHIQTLL